MKKNTYIFFLSVVMLFVLSAKSVLASENTSIIPETRINDFLISLNVPEDVISSLSYYGKLEIYNTLDKDAQFDGYSEEDVTLPSKENNISPMTIPSSDLQLRVTCFKNTDGTYSIYPSFIWKKSARVRNDVFGFVLDYSNWSTVAGEVSLNMHMVNSLPGRTDYHYYDRPTTSDFSGHAFKIPTLHGANNHYHYEGHAHFKARPKTSYVDKKIILRYGDDTNLFNFTASYSISIQAFSVSFTSSDSNFRQTAQTLSW